MDTETTMYERVMAHLDAKIRPQKVIADGSGVPFSTLTKIAQRQIKDPSVHTIQRLDDYFRQLDNAPACQCGRSHGDDRKAA